ncbi:MAG: hypothetical protein HC859_06375 [Bacteroidia bacterium]|nr:hypothetical protein [Bacteroidia bacterium]
MIETIPKEAVNRVAVLIFFVLLTVALLINLGARPLDFEEPRRAVVAIEMELNRDFVVPFTNGQYYYNKPPLWNWVLIGFTKIFGSKSEFVYRLPTVVSFLLIGFLLFRVSSKYLSREPYCWPPASRSPLRTSFSTPRSMRRSMYFIASWFLRKDVPYFTSSGANGICRCFLYPIFSPPQGFSLKVFLLSPSRVLLLWRG